MKYSNQVVFTATSSHCRSIVFSSSSLLSSWIVPSGLTSLESVVNVFSPICPESPFISASGDRGVDTCDESDGSDVASSLADEGGTVDPRTRSNGSSVVLGAIMASFSSGTGVGPSEVGRLVVGLGVGPGLDSWPI